MLTKFLNEEGDQAETANSPGEGAPPVRPDEPVNGGLVMTACQFLMQRNLAEHR